MSVRNYAPSDYELVIVWWKFHGVQIMPENCIPMTGFISEDEFGPAAYCSLYETNSAISFGENLVTRPHLRREDRKKHVSAVIQACKKHSDDNEKVLLALVDNKSAGHNLEDNGFKVVGSGLELYYREN